MANWVAPALGAAGGLLAGQLGARTTGNALDPGFSQDWRGAAATGASAILGAILATKGGRSRLGVVRRVPEAGATPESTVWRDRVDPVRSTVVGSLPFLGIPIAANAKKDVSQVTKATQGAFDVVKNVKDVTGGLADKYEAYRDYITDPKNIGRDVGLSVGGGVAGYLGGGALGRLVGKLTAPDDANATFEKRRRSEKLRNIAEAAGAVGLSTIGALAAPWAYHQLPAAPVPPVGSYVPTPAPAKPYVPVTKTASPDQPETNGPELTVPKPPGWPKRNIPFGDGENAGGWPFSASNAWLMKGTGGQPELFSCGLTIHQKVAEALAKLGVLTGGGTTGPLKNLPQGPQFVDWTNANPDYRAVVRDPEQFEHERQAVRNELATKTAEDTTLRLVAARLERQALVDTFHRELKHALEKLAANEREPTPPDHPSAPAEALRPRVEVVVYNNDGIRAIDKGQYVLFPGGGIDDGEEPRDALIRETHEELGHNLSNIEPGEVVESIWPKDFPGATPGFKGERTHFFLARENGESGMKHADQEPFLTTHQEDVRLWLERLIAGDKQGWATANNLARLRLVTKAEKQLEHPAMKRAAADEQVKLAVADAHLRLLCDQLEQGQPLVPDDDLDMDKQAAAAPMPGVQPNPNQQFVQQLAGKLKSRIAQQAPPPAAPPAGAPGQPAGGQPAAAQPAAGGGLPAQVYQPSAAPAAQPASTPLVNTASLKQTPSQLKHSQVTDLVAAVIRKLGAGLNTNTLTDTSTLDSGVENNLTPRPLAMKQTVEGNIHGLPQAAQQIDFAQQDVTDKTIKEPATMTSGTGSPMQRQTDVQPPLTPKIQAPVTPPPDGLPKQADAIRLLPKKQFLLFTPNGQLVVKRLANKRFTLPGEGEGRPAPYEQSVHLTPEQGVPETGYHGYDVSLHVGGAPGAPPGFEAVDPQSVLNDLYGGMGLSVNRPYMQLDRARGRAILRQMRKLKPASPAPEPLQTVAP